jgi:1-acyl-sn-glycerol-3-phosphate acyltransferase
MSVENTEDKVMRTVMRLVADFLARGRLKAQTTGLHHVPARGPAILIARHYHHLFDGVALHWAIPRRIHLLVTLDWATHPFTRHFMELLLYAARWPAVLRVEALERQQSGAQHKHGFTEADLVHYQHKALHESVRLLREGKLLVIFPEGYPNVDPHYTPKTRADQMLPFKSGFAAIAAAAEKRLGTKIPLIPVGFRYAVDRKWTAYTNFGRPLYAADFASRDALVKELERQVAALSHLSPSG